MIRSIKVYQSDDEARWITSLKRYWQYQATNKTSYPTALYNFSQQYSLHDGNFRRIDEIKNIPTKRDAIIVIQSYKNGPSLSSDVILVVMHFIGIRGPLKNNVPKDDIMFFDVEVLTGSVFRMTFSFSNGKTWSIKFTDFGVHVHDYRTSKF